MSKNGAIAAAVAVPIVLVVIVVVAILSAAAGFFGGMQYQKSQQSGFVRGAQNVENVFTGK